MIGDDPFFDYPYPGIKLSLESIDGNGDVVDQIFSVEHGFDPDVFNEGVTLETGRYRLSANTEVFGPKRLVREFTMTLKIPEPATGLLLVAALVISVRTRRGDGASEALGFAS